MISMGPLFLQKLNEEGIDRRHEIIYLNARAYREEFALFLHEFDEPYAFTSPADIYDHGISHKSLAERSDFEQPNSAFSWFCYQAGYSDRGPNHKIAIPPRRGVGILSVREWSYALWDNNRLFEWDALLHMLESHTTDAAISGAVSATYVIAAYVDADNDDDDYDDYDDDDATVDDATVEDAAAG